MNFACAFALTLAVGSAEVDVGSGAAPRSVTPYEIDIFLDVTLTSLYAVSLAALTASRDSFPFNAGCDADGPGRCNSDALLSIDRYAVGKRSETWNLVSDIGQNGSFLLPIVGYALDIYLSDSDTFWSDYGTDMLVTLQAMSLAGLATHTLKSLTQRPRPRQYASSTYRGNVESQLSFPSGHATSVGVTLATFSMTYWLRHPESPWRWVIAGATTLFGTVTTWGRVEAGAHFPTDTIAGLVLGAGIGLAIPWMHRIRPGSSLGVGHTDRGTPTLAATLPW